MWTKIDLWLCSDVICQPSIQILIIGGMSHDAILISDFKNIKIKSHFQMSVSLKHQFLSFSKLLMMG